MKFYRILTSKNAAGKWYETFEVPDNMPPLDGYTTVAPPENLRYPKWDYSLGEWSEDKDQLIAALSADLEVANNSIMDLMEMVSQLGGDANV